MPDAKKPKPRNRDIDINALSLPPNDFESALRGLLQTAPPEKQKAKKTPDKPQK